MANFISDELQEMWIIYDYKPCNVEMKYRGKRNGLPVTFQISPLSRSLNYKSDIEQLSLCQGVLETTAQDNLDYTLILIEKLGDNVVYRSRTCQQLFKGENDICDECSKLLIVKVEVREHKESKMPLKEESDDYNNESDDEDEEDGFMGHEESLDDHYEEPKVPVKLNILSKVKKPMAPNRKLKEVETVGEVKDSELRFRCNYCNVNFLNEEDYREHNDSNHTNPHGVPSCPECDYCDKARSKVMLHWVDAHRNEELYGFFAKYLQCCPHCDHGFFKKNHLQTHIKYVHGIDLPKSVCPICNEKCKDVSLHLKTFHRNGKYRCYRERCNVVKKGVLFETKAKLEAHIKTAHDDIKGSVSTCHICAKSFKYEAYHKFLRHMAQHDNIEKKFMCDECDKTFAFQPDLNQHKSRCHKKFMCDICSEVSSGKCQYKRHMASHNEDKFKCDQCDKTFTLKLYLQKHIKHIHIKNKNQVCKDCGKAFVRKSHLDVHMRLHSGQFEYCQFCNKGFAQRCNLKLHIQKNHADELS